MNYHNLILYNKNFILLLFKNDVQCCSLRQSNVTILASIQEYNTVLHKEELLTF